MTQNLQPSFLYVEDDAFSRDIMRVLFHNVLGYPQITIFEQSADFMTRVRALPSVPDVVFLDIQMKPYNGYDMLNMLRSDANYSQCKVIAMTASVMATDVQALKAAGFDGLIGKPIIRQTFPDLVKQILTGQAVWFVC